MRTTRIPAAQLLARMTLIEDGRSLRIGRVEHDTELNVVRVRIGSRGRSGTGNRSWWIDIPPTHFVTVRADIEGEPTR